jgi:Protein of unknown function (DUF3592)
MGFVYAALSAAFGLLALWAARYVTREMRRVRGWPSTPGAILERGVGEPMSQARVFMPRVVYSYEVDGTSYTNDQVYVIARTGNLKPVIERLVAGLPDPVPVYYNPGKPSESHLLKNPQGTWWILRGFGVVAILVGLVFLVTAL